MVFLTHDQVAERLGVSRVTVATFLDEGILPHVVIRGRRRIPADALEQWIRQQTEDALKAGRK